jgi:hypothetical protein
MRSGSFSGPFVPVIHSSADLKLLKSMP